MKKHYKKYSYPLHDIRRFLEPGPVVLVSSGYDGKYNIMTMGWHTVMEFTPALVGCVIAGSNYSFDLIRKSRECVINLPTSELLDEVAGIGNCSGAETDKFDRFKLTARKAVKVKSPLIAECYASFECRISDDSLVKKYNFFILEVVKAHVARSPKNPRTLHYRGGGEFILPGKVISRRKLFKAEML